MTAARKSPQSIRLCAYADIPDNGARGFTVETGSGTRQIFVVRKQGNIHAYENRCPHTGVNLDWQPDQFLDLSNTLIQCSTHGALFRIMDGLCVHGPCLNRYLTRVDTRVDEGILHILI
jgi:nitrite reductase/ring-hydroxylating ferredoxin subunit